MSPRGKIEAAKLNNDPLARGHAEGWAMQGNFAYHDVL